MGGGRAPILPDPLIRAHSQERNLFGLLALAFWVQLLRYVQYIPIVGPLARVLAKVLPDVAAFAVLFIIYLAGAAIAFSLTFGREVSGPCTPCPPLPRADACTHPFARWPSSAPCG